MTVETQDRYRGALLGLAVGDALGTTLEFKPPDTFSPLSDMVGGGPFNLEAGQWTDDTSMALCLATSLVEKEGFDAADQMRRYVNWWRHGYLSSTGTCFDIGVTTSQALKRFESTGEPFAGSEDPQSAGNGSIMRLAPVPMVFASDPKRATELAAESSKTTHAARTCVDACRYFAALIVGALQGESKENLLSTSYFLGELVPEIAEVARGSFKYKTPPSIKGSGYVVESLEAALWAFHSSQSFQEGALLAVNLGDDADTTGAVFGQLAGAYYGGAGIPENWLSLVTSRSDIETLANDLFKLSRSLG